MYKLRVAIFQSKINVLPHFLSSSDHYLRYEIVKICETKHDAIQFLELDKPDLIILDSFFNNEPALSTAKLIRHLHPNVCVVVLSALHDEQLAIKFIETGVNGYFSANGVSEKIVENILNVYLGENPLCPIVTRCLMDKIRLGIMSQRDTNVDNDINFLTKREKDILSLISQGKSDKTIGQILGISYLTAQTHTKNIYRKLKVKSRTEAIFKSAILDNAIDRIQAK